MMSQTVKQIFAVHILPNNSRSKSNQTMKFGQITKYSMRKTFSFKEHVKYDVGRLVPVHVFLYSVYKIKANGQ